jgi:hypothetical protein
MQRAIGQSALDYVVWLWLPDKRQSYFRKEGIGTTNDERSLRLLNLDGRP